MWKQALPETEGLQQPTGGMGEGVGPGPLGKAVGRAGIVKNNPPSGGGEGQGGHTTCRAGTADEGTGGVRHGHKKTHSRKSAVGDGGTVGLISRGQADHG